MLDLSAIRTESWTQEPLPNPYVQAYQLGRLCNALNWIMHREALGQGRPAAPEVDDVLNMLVELARLISGTDGKPPLTIAIAEIRGYWVQEMGSDEVPSARDVLADQIFEDFDVWSPRAWNLSAWISEACDAQMNSTQRSGPGVGRAGGPRPATPTRA